MNPGAGLIFFYGLPLVLVGSCVWAAFPWGRRRSRTVVLIMLLVACAAFATWCAVDGFGWGGVVVAPAVAIAVMRLMLDGFSIVAEHVESRDL